MTARAVFVLCTLFAAPAAAADDVQFNRDIRPFLSDTCFQCHGPDADAREADLRLDLEDAAKKPRQTGTPIVPGEPAASEIIRRVLTDDPDLRMPPPGSGLTLTARQKALLTRWVADGARYQKHWAFEPIVRPEWPAAPAGPAKATPIDAFIAARLEQAGLTPLGTATPETQLRRVSLDLTGFPPTLEEIDAYLDDVRERGIDAAFEAAVDRLLQSPRFGERMAWQWLEASRYADTDGYQNDGPREMWRWRDWVIDAYNQNLPFDQFTIEQIAGDLLPEPTHAQLIATAFNRNHRYNSEAGIPIDEFLLENAADRVETTATVWLGLTIGCARCHNHKFDPFTQRDYYQLIDYFNDIAESGRAIKIGNSEPWIQSPTSEQRQQLTALNQTFEQAEQALRAAGPAIAAAQTEWERNPMWNGPVLSDGLDHYFDFDADDPRVVVKNGQPVLRNGFRGTAATVGGQGSFETGSIPGLIGNGRFSVAFWMRPEQVGSGAVLSSEKPDTQRQGNLVEFVNGRLRWNIIHRWISGVSTIESLREFQPGEWVHITLTNDGTQRASGMLLYINGELQNVAEIRNTNSNTASRTLGGAMTIGFSPHAGFWRGQLDELRFYTQRTVSPQEVRLLAVNETPEEVVAIAAPRRSESQRELLRLAFLEQAADPQLAELLAAVRKAESARTRFSDGLPTTMITRDLPDGRPSFIRIRGVYDRFGEQVTANVPEQLPPLPPDQKNDRLAFARWLVSSRNPLTARVTVNRYWQLLFGRGLVRTPEDFGAQGDPPTHPELLDWLAAEFIALNWDVKRLLQTIVLSETYRRSARVTPEHYSADPDNELLARAPRLRLPGNVLRDQALFVSGLLVEKTGGPSVKPYQPANLWEEASNFNYSAGQGADLYRRSLYTYWKRTLAPPTLSLLDSADRESCSIRPRRTNTPLQALTLLNDVTFAEAARKLAERILNSGGATDGARIAFAFRTVAARPPEAREVAVLQEALDTYRVEFRGQPAQAAATLTVGSSAADPKLDAAELAAMTALANVLLNLDEVTTRE